VPAISNSDTSATETVSVLFIETPDIPILEKILHSAKAVAGLKPHTTAFIGGKSYLGLVPTVKGAISGAPTPWIPDGPEKPGASGP
jgi:hypothetical protein